MTALKNLVENIFHGKAGVAAAAGASGAVVTWIEQANQWVDFTAGVTAIIASLFAIAWYIRKWKDDKQAKGEDD